jgi:peroxiredoxin
MFIRTGSAAIAVALLLGTGLVAAPSALDAQTGALAFTPERPRAGEAIEVSYRPAANLAGEGTLRLRARVRNPEHDSYNTGMGSVEVARLDVGADGVARGAFRLPDEAVYAAFAVETPDATRTDSREGRFWEILVHGDDGRPPLEALEQRFNDYMGRDMSEVLETARTMSRVHPDSPRAWAMLRAAESWGGAADDEEARAARHLARLVELDRTLRAAPDLSATDVGYMYWYARGPGSEEIGGRWRERLLADHPAHFFAVQERIGALRRDHGDDVTAFLAALEPLWQNAADRQVRQRVVSSGLQFARQTGDPDAILRWVDRSVDTDPASATWAATTLSNIDATRDEGIRRLRAAIPELARGADGERALGQTAAEHEASVAMRVAGLRASLGRALVAAGRVGEAIVELERAASVGWSAARLRSLAEARLAAGDSAGAVSAFAAVAADPGTAEATADSLRATAGVPRDAWAAEVERARRTMLERTLATAREDEVGSPSGRLRGGGVAKLTELLGPEATVVVFWSRYCGPSIEAMPRIAAVAVRLAAAGVPLLAVTRDSPAAAEEYLDEGDFDLTVVFDVEGALGQALNNWGTPQYYVLDGAGRLRFVSSLDALLRHTTALRGLP